MPNNISPSSSNGIYFKKETLHFRGNRHESQLQKLTAPRARDEITQDEDDKELHDAMHKIDANVF